MFLAEPLAYLQLQKTACTHTARLLAHVCGGQQMEKHKRIPEEVRPRIRFVLGSVRNPWDWYVSVWAAGCGGKRRLFRPPGTPASGPHPRANLWCGIYADADNPELFRDWLRRIHDPETRADMAPEFAASPASDACGLMTYAYAHLYAANVAELDDPAIASTDRLRAVVADNILDATIRTERLESDLVSALTRCGVQLRDEHLEFIWSAPRTNTSAHRHMSYYYDRATRDFVAARDRFLIERYAYTAPPV